MQLSNQKSITAGTMLKQRIHHHHCITSHYNTTYWHCCGITRIHHRTSSGGNLDDAQNRQNQKHPPSQAAITQNKHPSGARLQTFRREPSSEMFQIE
jgi:hypothetical protein